MQNQSRDFADAVQSECNTYDELLDNGFLDDSERKRLMADATLGNAAAIMAQRGDLNTAKLFLDVVNAVFEWDYECQEEDLWIEVASEHRAQFTEKRS